MLDNNYEEKLQCIGQGHGQVLREDICGCRPQTMSAGTFMRPVV